MRILLRFSLDCEPDAAWRALRDPAVFRAVSAPFTTFTSLEPGGFPESWPEAPQRLAAKAFGRVPVGEQVVDLSFWRVRDIRLLRDSGGGTSGLLGVITTWRHTMAVAPVDHTPYGAHEARGPDHGTLYRDQLVFGAGILTPAIWPVLWAFWQYRGWRIRRLSKGWRA